MTGRLSLPRNADFGLLLETVLLSAVATILVIRTQLYLTHYPQLGGGRLHIAHLLYGGALMLVAITLLLMFVGRPVRRPAAILGGIGFGFFIDELGKFITEDNDYFFRPAAALIYLIFVGLFVGLAALQRHSGLTSAERLRNAMDRLGEAAWRRFDEEDRRVVTELLDGVDPADPLLEPVRRLLGEVRAMPARPPSVASRLAEAAHERYGSVAARPGFPTAVAWVYGVWAALSLLAVSELVFSVGVDVPGALPGFRSDAVGDLWVINVLSLASSGLSAVLVIVGLVRLRSGAREAGYRWFDRAILVSIFLTRVFAFVESQFGAVFGLAVDLVLLLLIRTVLAEEHRQAAPERERALDGAPADLTAPSVGAAGRAEA